MFKKSLDAFGSITVTEILVFIIPFVLAVLIDLKSHKKGKAIVLKDAALWSLIWVTCAMAFAVFI